jgi:Sulfatase
MPHISDTFENDTKMFQMFGFKDRYLANGAGNVPSQSVIRRAQETLAGIPNVAADEKLRGHLEPRLTLDLMALERLEDDIRAFNAKGQPFVAAFMPQMGHGPWFDLVGTTDVTNRGEAIVRLQLKWLEGLVEQLRASGALAKTVIVLTADHGVRTTQEDPSFIPSTLSDYSFEVPFLIFAPNALHGTKIISAPTSHVDIGPTLLTLLSVEHSRWPMQGTVIWNPHLHDRLLYFFAADYYGSDGTCSKGQFVSCSVMTEECRRNNRFEFPPTTSLPPAEAQNTQDFLRDAGSLQERIAELLSDDALSARKKYFSHTNSKAKLGQSVLFSLSHRAQQQHSLLRSPSARDSRGSASRQRSETEPPGYDTGPGSQKSSECQGDRETEGTGSSVPTPPESLAGAE